MSLLGEVLAGWAGEKLVHDENIIAFTMMECIKKSLLRLLIHTHVIHIQELWELRRFVRDIIGCNFEKMNHPEADPPPDD